MYTIVLMAAMTTASDAPGCWHSCGCHGGGYSSCHGGWGNCHGGCYGGYGYGGCSGWYGGCYGGCYGGYGYGYGCCGGCWGSVVPVMPAAPAKPAEMAPAPKPADGKTALPYQGKLLVELPDNSKLFVDDQPIAMPSGKKTFNTPVLQPGQAYYYMVRVETTINGKTYQDSKQVIVRAGQVSEVAFPELTARVNQAKANVAGAQ